MPLEFDPEFQSELEKISERCSRDGNRLICGNSAWTVAGFAGFFALVSQFDLSETVVLTLTIAFAALSIVVAITSTARITHRHLMLTVATTEWVGRKHLGEYVRPSV